ncbi:MAG TPA: hypothetical protein VFN67_02075 [Polyangiales bacterium]|nr:hypothetical protein [Polyangiales bacterium]
MVAGWKSPKGFDGVVTMVRLYESVWMAYHLAKVSGPSASGMPGKLVLRDFPAVRMNTSWPRTTHATCERC